MPENRLAQLIARKMAGEATEAELQELREYLAAHPDEQYLAEILDAYWSQHPDLQEEDTSDEEERFQRILSSADDEPVVPGGFVDYSVEATPVRKLSGKKIWSYAAAAVILIATGLFFLSRNGHRREPSPKIAAVQPLPLNKISEVTARRGSKSKLVLPDGTQVWLNGGSSLSYSNDFNQHMREVNLDGEAFFDVTRDKDHPFIVHTSGINIKVLGTEFNVKSYAEDQTIEATLMRGSIEVSKKDDPVAPKVILRPHEKLVFNKVLQTTATSPDSYRGGTPHGWTDAGISVTTLPKDQPDSAREETSWVYNKLIFDGDSFDEVAKKMERWYNVMIIIHDETLKQVRLKGVFENETISQALDALQLITPFDYSITANNIDIYRKKE